MGPFSRFFARLRAVDQHLFPQKTCKPAFNPHRDPAKRRQAIIVMTGGTATFVGMCLYTGDEKFYRQFVNPALRLMDPETAHRAAVWSASVGLLPRPRNHWKDDEEDGKLGVTVFGRRFRNPVGLAAGFDKDAECYQNLLKVGFGFVEVGSVTPKPQSGNEKPRIFRLTRDEAIVNRCGFNSAGHDAVLERVARGNRDDGLLGVNLGKNKESEDAGEDFAKGIRKFGPYADYLVINVSSPNTPGLRSHQTGSLLADVLGKAKRAKDEVEVKLGKHIPLVVKVSPDLSANDIGEMSKAFLDPSFGVDGIIVSNTTVSRDKSLASPEKLEAGGLSGKPLRDLSTSVISSFYRATGGKIPIIGVGGVFSGDDAYEKIRAGASLVQIYTAMVYNGPGVVASIKKRLAERLKQDGFEDLKDAVGADHRRNLDIL